MRALCVRTVPCLRMWVRGGRCLVVVSVLSPGAIVAPGNVRVGACGMRGWIGCVETVLLRVRRPRVRSAHPPAVVPDCVLVCRTVPRVSRGRGRGQLSHVPVRATVMLCVCKRIHTPSIHPRHPFGPIRSSVRTRVLSEVHVAVRGHGDLFIRCIVGWDIVIYINTSIYILNTAKA